MAQGCCTASGSKGNASDEPLSRVVKPSPSRRKSTRKPSIRAMSAAVQAARTERKIIGGCQPFQARSRPVTLLQTGAPRCSHVMISGVHRAAVWLVRLAQSCGPNGSLRLWGFPVSVACCAERRWPFLRGAPKCIRCAIALTWNDFLKAVTKLGKMKPTLSIPVLALIFTPHHGCRM